VQVYNPPISDPKTTCFVRRFEVWLKPNKAGGSNILNNCIFAFCPVLALELVSAHPSSLSSSRFEIWQLWKGSQASDNTILSSVQRLSSFVLLCFSFKACIPPSFLQTCEPLVSSLVNLWFVILWFLWASFFQARVILSWVGSY